MVAARLRATFDCEQKRVRLCVVRREEKNTTEGLDSGWRISLTALHNGEVVSSGELFRIFHESRLQERNGI